MEHKGQIKKIEKVVEKKKDKLYTYEELTKEKSEAVSKAIYNYDKRTARENLMKEVLPSMLVFRDASYKKMCKKHGLTAQQMKCLLLGYIYYEYYKNNSPYFTSTDLHLLSKESKTKMAIQLKELERKGLLEYVGSGNYRKRKKISPSNAKNYAMNAKGGEIIRQLSLSIQNDFKWGIEALSKDWSSRPKY